MSLTSELPPPLWSIDPAILERCARLPTATLSAQLRNAGVAGAVLGGLDALRPDLRLLGVARTLRYVPARSDLVADFGMGVQRSLLETLREGDVLVIEARDERGAGVIGDISALRAARLGASGVISDGPIRDAEAIAGFGLAVYHRGRHPAQPSQQHVPVESDRIVSVAGVAVAPGDLLVGDLDGVVVLPARHLVDVVSAAGAQEDEERWIAEQVDAGASLDGLFPMGQQWRARYLAQRPESGQGGSTGPE